jgi:hypothetical protein
MHPFTDEEFKELLHIIWMSEDDWDPAAICAELEIGERV